MFVSEDEWAVQKCVDSRADFPERELQTVFELGSGTHTHTHRRKQAYSAYIIYLLCVCVIFLSSATHPCS